MGLSGGGGVVEGGGEEKELIYQEKRRNEGQCFFFLKNKYRGVHQMRLLHRHSFYNCLQLYNVSRLLFTPKNNHIWRSKITGDGRTDGRTDRRTRPLIEMRERI